MLGGLRAPGGTQRAATPRELLGRQCGISFEPDEITLALTAVHLGADKVLWASDYPHPDAKIPGVVKELKEAVATLPPESQVEVLGQSARRFYGL